MGRLPLHRLPRRRRGRAGQPQRAADDPLLPRDRRPRCGRSCRSAAWSTARSSSPDRRTSSTSRRCCSASTRPRPGSKLLAEQTPASFVAFDLLALGDEAYLDVPFGERRRSSTGCWPASTPPVHRDPGHRRPGRGPAVVRRVRGRGLDGVMAKPVDGPYEPDKRAMLKVKHERTADCVVAGFRWHKTSARSAAARLAAARPVRRRRAGCSTSASSPLPDGAPGRAGRGAGALAGERGAGPSLAGLGRGARPRPSGADAGRASPAGTRKKDLSWEPLRPERVVEVRYDHMEGSRFRHTAQFVRWRPDREPRSCTYEQLDVPVSYDLASLLS